MKLIKIKKPNSNPGEKKEIEHSKLLAQKNTEKIWGWGTPAGRQRAQRRAELILKSGNVSSNCHILEIGCGSGAFTEKFAETGAKITAVDISPDLLILSRQRRLPQNQVLFVESSVEDLDIHDQFDSVIGSSILHHLILSKSLPKIFSLLKPGGYFCFAEPNMLNPQVFCERRFRFLFPYVSQTETAFVRFKLQRQLRKAGFSEISTIPFDWLHPSIPSPLIGLIALLGQMFEKTPIIREFSGSILITARRPVCI